ncbi:MULTISPECIES: hypothetical protein [Roseateles]|uniref:Uncharacterized protein n=1 Tax=Pelomonas caseinilytica TaxID=2906763 RepID=A0ABS8XDF8_9BURK|nr:MULTISPECIES: hypothetical protein [unclassified Roseateles]MCE4537442.1 hypothetical protein [Pelomonas sp. P7]HEV6968963.1 hypothetical protein [Roseateles sp.]
MNNAKRLLGTLVLLALFGGALFFALRSNEEHKQIAQEQAAIASAEPLKGLIAVDVEAFFKDDRVAKVLGAARLPVQVARVGSRDMAAKIGTADQPDFFIASGVVAANMIADAARKAGRNATQTSPFHTPLVVASWEPVAKILAANGMAKAQAPKVYSLDMEKLTQAMLAKQRWRDLKASGDYAVSRSVLVSTTDIRRSNSAAMYLALTSAALNGDVVADRTAAQKYATQLAELFKRQGFQENYVNGAFDDYLSIGMGKTPLTFIYEAQMVAQALKGGVRPEMVLMYPQPTIVNKWVLVALNERGRQLAELLSTNKTLQAVALEQGFRTGDTAAFAEAAKTAGLAVDVKLNQVIDPPGFDLMFEMIDIVSREMNQ